MMYKYNGVRLPEQTEAALAFPYRVIYENNGKYILFCCDEPMLYDDHTWGLYGGEGNHGVLGFPDGATIAACCCSPYSTAWLNYDAPTFGVIDGYHVLLGSDLRCHVWSNIDIYYNTGNLAAYGSVPVPAVDCSVPYAYNIRRWVKGYTHALAGDVLPRGNVHEIMGYLAGKRVAEMRNKVERTPVAYLYAGVQLPPMPDSEYPYRVIVCDGTLKWSQLCVSTVPLVYRSGRVFLPGGTAGKAVVYEQAADGLLEITAGPYGKTKEVESDGSDSYGTVVGGYMFTRSTLWANYDLLHADTGNVVLATSEPPVPVYGVLYNGLRMLPLPVWDKETCPYITMLKNSRPEYWLVITKEPPTFDGENICFADGTSQEGWTALPDAVKWYEYSWDYAHPNGSYEYTPYVPVWSNTNIYNTDGSLYLAASAPVYE